MSETLEMAAWIVGGLAIVGLWLWLDWRWAKRMDDYSKRHGIDISKAPPRSQWGEWW